MEPNRLRHLLNTASDATGTLLLSESVANTRLLGRLGFDFLIADIQHGSWSNDRVHLAAAAVDSPTCSVLARVQADRPDQIEWMLDAGCDGVMVPMVNDRAAAERAVAACRYPPAGRRSVGGVRNLLVRGSEYPARSDDDVVCIVQIEHVDALDRLDEILEVPGIDVVSPGHVDLARSMGHVSDYNASIDFGGPGPVGEALDAIAAACRHRGIPMMPVIGSTEQYHAQHAAGHRVICLASDYHLLQDAARRALREVEEARSGA